MPFKLSISDLRGSVDRFLKAWATVRVCPDKMATPDEKTTSIDPLALVISLLIFMLARRSVAGGNTGIGTDVVATLISAFIAFAAGYVELIFDPTDAGRICAQKWTTLFSFLWLTSLIIVIVADAIPIWNHARPLTSIIIDMVFVPGTLSGMIKNLLRAFIIGAVAVLVLLFKTRRMDRSFTPFERCSLITLLFGFGMNALLMLLFLYGDVI